MGARSYDPELGRFISEDPLGLSAGINPYAYVGNSPVNGTDPSGLDCYFTWTDNPWCDDATELKVLVQGGGGGAGAVGGYGGSPATGLGGDGDGAGPNSGFAAFGFAGGGGFAEGGAGSLGQSQVGSSGPSCGGAVLNFVITAAGDVAFFSGVYAGVRAAKAAKFAAEWAQTYGEEQKLRAMYAATRSQITARSTSSIAFQGAEASYTTSRIQQLGLALVGNGLGTPGFKGIDLIPGLASLDTGLQMVRACF